MADRKRNRKRHTNKTKKEVLGPSKVNVDMRISVTSCFLFLHSSVGEILNTTADVHSKMELTIMGLSNSTFNTHPFYIFSLSGVFLVIAEELMRKINREKNNLNQTVNKILPERHASVLLRQKGVCWVLVFLTAQANIMITRVKCLFFHFSIHDAFF